MSDKAPTDRALLLRERHEALQERKRVQLRQREISIDHQVEEANKSLDGVTIAVESIDPAKAAAMLAHSKGNRPMRAQHVAWLAEQMRSGQWRLTHQGVAISKGLRLLDGHHRLEAVSKSQATIPMLVIRGLPDDTWAAIDCGVTRAVHDRIQLHVDPSLNRRIMEVIQTLIRIERGHRGKFTNEQILAEWEPNKASFLAIMGEFPKPIVGISRAPMLGALVRFHMRHGGGHAVAFARQLASRDLPPEGSPARTLRAWLMEGVPGITAGTLLSEILYWHTVHACLSHRDGLLMPHVVRATAWT